jgi:hypothetical protein
MNHTERVAGTVFFLVYLLALPVLAGKLFALIGTLLGVSALLAALCFPLVLLVRRVPGLRRLL